MRVLGLDLGTKTLGIAVSTSDMKMALSKETYRFENEDYLNACKYLKKYIDEYKVSLIVLGLPKHMNGDDGVRAQASYNFKKMLIEQYNVEVELIDERLTTSITLNNLAFLSTNSKKRKQLVDQLAAQTILQDYLDRKQNEQ